MITPESIDVTVTRQEKEEESDSSFLNKKPRIEEEEEMEEEEDISKGNSSWCSPPPSPEPEPQPQWDVDSQEDREYISDPEARKHFSDDEDYDDYRTWRREVIDSKGFIKDECNGIYEFEGLDSRFDDTMSGREWLTGLANLCFKKLNEDTGKCVQFDSIVRATASGTTAWKIHITCMARESPNGTPVEYQAKVMRYARNYRPPFPIFCRPAPPKLIV